MKTRSTKGTLAKPLENNKQDVVSVRSAESRKERADALRRVVNGLVVAEKLLSTNASPEAVAEAYQGLHRLSGLLARKEVKDDLGQELAKLRKDHPTWFEEIPRLRYDAPAKQPREDEPSSAATTALTTAGTVSAEEVRAIVKAELSGRGNRFAREAMELLGKSKDDAPVLNLDSLRVAASPVMLLAFARSSGVTQDDLCPRHSSQLIASPFAHELLEVLTRKLGSSSDDAVLRQYTIAVLKLLRQLSRENADLSLAEFHALYREDIEEADRLADVLMERYTYNHLGSAAADSYRAARKVNAQLLPVEQEAAIAAATKTKRNQNEGSRMSYDRKATPTRGRNRRRQGQKRPRNEEAEPRAPPQRKPSN